MLYVDIPTRADIERLGAVRAACVSIYLPTTPLTQDAQADRIALKNLAASAVEQLRSLGTAKAELAAIEEALADLVDDDEFWRFQAHSLAVLATALGLAGAIDTVADETLTFRLPNALQPVGLASDRFFIKPLLRAATASQSAYVLALAQGSVRLVEVSGDLPSVTVKVEGLPSDVASSVGKASIKDRSPGGRIQGAEGQKLRMRQYARQIDQALRDLLAGSETPLILAAVQPLDAIFRSVCSYPHLVSESIAGNPEQSTDLELGQAARAVLDRLHRTELDQQHTLFEARSAQGRTTTDIAQAAKAATFGAVATLLVDTGTTVVMATHDHGVVDQIAARALASGARVLGLRRADIPGGGSLAALLRYAF